jgi:hypothetical protein
MSLVADYNQSDREAEMGGRVFRDDVIIAAVSKKGKKKLYKISQAQLKTFEVPFENDSDYDKVVELLKSGVQVAAVPVEEEDGGAHARGDMMCYLLNLSGLRTLTDWEDGDGGKKKKDRKNKK